MDRSQENKAVVRLYAECMNKGDQSCLYDTLSEDYVHHSFQETFRGKDDFWRGLSEMQAAFPDLSIKVEDQVAEGDKVVNRITVTGTHEGEFNGVPATHTKVETSGIGMFYLRDGKIYEQWSEINVVRMLGQIGALPTDGPEGG